MLTKKVRCIVYLLVMAATSAHASDPYSIVTCAEMEAIGIEPSAISFHDHDESSVIVDTDDMEHLPYLMDFDCQPIVVLSHVQRRGTLIDCRKREPRVDARSVANVMEYNFPDQHASLA